MNDEIKLWINGGARPSHGDRWFEAINPATGEVTGRVAHADASDVDEAVQGARRALRGPWGAMSLADRCALLVKVADRIDARQQEFLEAEVLDTGKPVSSARRIDIPRGAANFRIFANLASSMPGRSFWQDTPDGLGALHYVERAPVGVVGVICPWNLPLLLMTWKVAPALAAGNTVVVKPSEETPRTATLLGEVMREVGVPDGVYHVVHGFGAGSAGEALVQHPDVSAITFTGETSTGRAIMAGSAAHLKRLSFELGGKNPALIFAEADVERAVAGTLRSVFTNCGQVCLCSERVYVQRPIFQQFVEAMAQGARELRLGDPWREDTTMGPLISRQHRDKVLSYYALAREEGAEVITGGGIPTFGSAHDGGFYVEPTLWTGLSERARCVREEIFGPVCHIQPFDEEEEAIAMANDTPYGLCAAVWTQDVSRAHRVARAVEVGQVWVNDWYVRDLRTPFGGVKTSGLGREGGEYSLDMYSELKNICIKL